MVSKNRINHYQLRLFLPLALLLWLIIIVFTVVQRDRERIYRENYVKQQAEIINKRIIALCENEQDFHSFMQFVDQFLSQTILDDTSVAIFDNNTNLKIADIGFTAPTPNNINITQGKISGSTLNQGTSEDLNIDLDRAFFYREDSTANGRYRVQTIIPDSPKINNELNKSNWWWWLFIVVCGIIMTLITYFATRHLTRNVQLLRKLAEAAAKDKEFTAIDSFPNDDLGEISKRITEIYSSMKAAQVSREIEHRVALKATEEQNQIRRQLTNNLSHELKTPVGIIRGYIETILENPDMDEEARTHFMKKTQTQVERLCTLLDDMSTITRLDEAATKIPTEPINFNELLSNVASDLNDSGVLGDMTFRYNIPDNCIVTGNGPLLTGAIMNLAKNAIHYSKGTEMGVDLLARNQRFYTFIFYDNGVGVEPEHIPHLFERFYRVDKGRSRKVGGTGLGLPIVKSTINTMGGTITVRNRKTGGLEFVFTLNIWAPKDKNKKTQTKPKK